MQTTNQTKQETQLLISDLCNFTIYIHAQKEHIEKWFKERSNNFKDNAKANDSINGQRYIQLSVELANMIAEKKLLEINEKNVKDNIYPTIQRAHLVLSKEFDHSVKKVSLRKF